MNTTDLPFDSRLGDALRTRYARRVAARLEELDTPADIGERLRFARERAVERARELRTTAQPATRTVGAGALAFGGGWWVRAASLLPLVLLVGGLVLIQERQLSAQITAAAEIDAAILADDLPPAAYSDPGFAAYLRVTSE
jgi:hypothetical protein